MGVEGGWRGLSRGFQRSRRKTRRAWEFHRIPRGDGAGSKELPSIPTATERPV